VATWTSESDLAKELGLSRQQLVALRRVHLRYGMWRRHKLHGRKIMISTNGQAILRERAAEQRKDGDANGNTDTPINATSNPEAAPEKLVLSVTKIPMNPYLLFCTDQTGNPYHVRVKSNLKYVVHDKLFAIPDLQPGYWRQCGPEPRFKGDGHYKRYFPVTV
jgi:hypothetical protein